MINFLANNWYIFLSLTLLSYVALYLLGYQLKQTLLERKINLSVEPPTDVLILSVSVIFFSLAYFALKWTTIVAIILALINYSR